MEKEKALALQRELERAAREKERRELEERRKALEEKRKLVGSLRDERASTWAVVPLEPGGGFKTGSFLFLCAGGTAAPGCRAESRKGERGC